MKFKALDQTKCRDSGEPGCLEIVDPEFEMRFDDIGEAPLQWCSHCGARARVMGQMLDDGFDNIPGFADILKKQLDDHETRFGVFGMFDESANNAGNSN